MRGKFKQMYNIFTFSFVMMKEITSPKRNVKMETWKLWRLHSIVKIQNEGKES